jgi:hypothetical protein
MVGFDVSNYQPPGPNLERRTKALAYVLLPAPILSGVAMVLMAVYLMCECEFYILYNCVMTVLFAGIAAFMMGIGGDIFTIQSDIDALVLPYRVLWLDNQSVWRVEVESDFRCCGFDETSASRVEMRCPVSWPICRTEIPAEFDRDEMGLAITTLVFGVIDAVITILWAIIAIWELCDRAAQVDGQPPPSSHPGEPTFPAPAPCPDASALPDPESPSPLCPDGYPGAQSPLYQEAVPGPYPGAGPLPPARNAEASCVP